AGGFSSRRRTARSLPTACPVALLPFEHHFIDIAPEPILARLDRLDDRMFRLVKMLRGVFVFRTVAASDVSAFSAEPQVHPRVSHFQALFAAMRCRFYVLDLVGVRTDFSHCASCILNCGLDRNANFETGVARFR